ncbi:MAG: phage integrase N-terminal SAM-like domain-containing protein [Ardenticatenia bacterium]|nr:phage integrase N-terminal SAM-like domain-containing protein [Ardenticatenia bacterium]
MRIFGDSHDATTQEPARPSVRCSTATHHTYSTEKAYAYWAKRFILYHNRRHPLQMGEKGISEFLTYLAVEENVAASTPSMILLEESYAIGLPVLSRIFQQHPP